MNLLRIRHIEGGEVITLIAQRHHNKLANQAKVYVLQVRGAHCQGFALAKGRIKAQLLGQR
ncbi:hypothetical protein D3C76_1802840 [compost metagenome]